MLTHQPTLQNSNSFPKAFPRALSRLTAIAAMAGFAATASICAHAAGGGEFLDIELPSMRTPIEAVQAPSLAAMVTAPTAPTTTAQNEPLTRAHVLESLALARLANLVTPSGELGDTAAVLQAREDFNALQTEVMQAEYRTAALQLQQAQMDALVSQAEGYAPAAGAAETLQLESSAGVQTVEVVVVSSDKVYEVLLEGGHAADVTRAKGPTEVEAAATAGPVAVLVLVNDSAATEPGDAPGSIDSINAASSATVQRLLGD